MNHPRSALVGRTRKLGSTALQPSLTFGDPQRGRAGTTLGASTLSSSLLQDLQRVAEAPQATDLLSFCAASVRHRKPMELGVELGGEACELRLDPVRGMYHCALDLCAASDPMLSTLRMTRVQVDERSDALPAGLHRGALRPLLWHLALRGPVAEPLPEIAGPIRCRVSLGTPLGGLPLDDSRRRLIERMKSAPVSADNLAKACDLSHAAVHRMWNALYLQSALMITRPLPAD